MNDPTSLLFGLDSFVVLDVGRVEDQVVQVVIESRSREAGCPGCGVLTSRVKERPLVALKDVSASGQRVRLWWRKRRLVCGERACEVRSFTQADPAIPPRSRLTARLRQHLAMAVAGSNRAVEEVAREHGVSWPTVHRAHVAAAARWLPPPEPTPVLGIDETRARSVRWVLEPSGWKRSNPWLTSFVDVDPSRAGLLLGLALGRSGACVKDWLAEQTPQFRAAVQVVVIDPSAPYASGVRAALPHAAITVDKWHLVRLGNDMVTDVRQRVARERHGLGLQRTPAPAAGLTHRARRDPPPALALLRRLRHCGHARDHPPRNHDRDLVAGDPRGHRDRHHERPHRGLQPADQADQASRLRLPQHGQLPTAHTHPHRRHPTARAGSMTAPLKVGEPACLGIELTPVIFSVIL